MAQQTPNPSVRVHREGPVFNPNDSNDADDDFNCETEILRSYRSYRSLFIGGRQISRDAFSAPQDLLIRDARSRAVEDLRTTILESFPIAPSPYDWRYRRSTEPLRRSDDRGSSDELRNLIEYCIEFITEKQLRLDRERELVGSYYTRAADHREDREWRSKTRRSRRSPWCLDELECIGTCPMKTEKQLSLDREYFFKSLSFTRAGDYREGHKWLSNLLGPKQLQFLDHAKYDSSPWEVDHSSFGTVYKGWMFREARSEQQLCSDKIVCQDSGNKSKWDMQGLSKSLWDMLLRDFPELRQTNSPSLHTGSNMCKKLNIQPSLSHVKQMSTDPENNLSQYNGESCVAIGIDLMEAVTFEGQKTSQNLDYSTDCNLNKHKETMPKDLMFQVDETFNQHKRKESTKRVSSFVIFPIICLWLLLVTSSQTPLDKHLGATSIHVQPQHKEHGPVSIGVPLLGLFSFMAFVWAVAAMILVEAQFTRMHSVIFLVWVFLIIRIVLSDNSISTLYLLILGISFMGWYEVCSWKSNKKVVGEKEG